MINLYVTNFHSDATAKENFIAEFYYDKRISRYVQDFRRKSKVRLSYHVVFSVFIEKKSNKTAFCKTIYFLLFFWTFICYVNIWRHHFYRFFRSLVLTVCWRSLCFVVLFQVIPLTKSRQRIFSLFHKWHILKFAFHRKMLSTQISHLRQVLTKKFM